jgi:hypothetical protein
MNVAFLIFNRPELTARVFAEIARARPERLLVVADGPRAEFPGEAEKVAAARAIVERVDWPCEVLKNYADTNLGCKRRVSSGLDWVFAQVEDALVLEDDCLPHPSFFPFCRELLERYRHDSRIMHISGDNFQDGIRRTPYSYYFSKYIHIWGWASWRRAWQHYDVNLSTWPALKKNVFQNFAWDSTSEKSFWFDIFERMQAGKIDTWDYAVNYAFWCQSGLSILPECNLVSNIGFTATASHTGIQSSLANRPVKDIGSLIHPPYITRNVCADAYTYEHVYRGSTAQRQTLTQKLRSRHFYGSIIRSMPGVGGWWSRIRTKSHGHGEIV